jgi:multiple sugar transport system permease protein
MSTLGTPQSPIAPGPQPQLSYLGPTSPASAAAVVSRRPSTGRRRPWAHLPRVIIGAVAAVPFLWMLSTSLKTGDGANAFPPQWIPRPLTLRAYVDVLHSPKVDFLLWMRNTLVVEVLVVAGTTLSSAIVGYGFAKVRFRGRGALFVLMLATMMIPFPVTMVSLFTVFRWLGDHTGIPFLGTFKPLWLPAWFASAFNVFLLRQFFLTIPDELSEAARIDGCGDVGIFCRVMLPLSKPALTVVALLAFLATWNDYLGPLVYLQRPEQFTLALGLANLQSAQGGTSWPILMAASVLVILPVLALFFLAQRTFVEGIATTGMKG